MPCQDCLDEIESDEHDSSCDCDCHEDDEYDEEKLLKIFSHVTFKCQKKVILQADSPLLYYLLTS